MRCFGIITLIVAIIGINFPGTVLADASRKADFYVSVDGSDNWSGSLSSPDAGGSDGPFATLERARDAVRDLKKSKKTDIVVLVRGGTYQLDKTVVFGLEDSGEGESTITYAAYPGEKPRFSSAVEISGWKPLATPLPDLPKAARGKVWVANVPRMDGAPWRFFAL